MSKKTIALLFIIGIVVAIIGGVVFGIATGSVAAAGITATNAAGATAASVQAAEVAAGTAAATLLLIGGIVLFIGGILSTISWIGALVAVGKQGRWGWFVCILLLSGLGELIYLIAGPGLNTASAPIQQM